MLHYIACVALALAFTNIAQCNSAEFLEESFVNRIDSLPTSRFIQRRKNSSGMGQERRQNGLSSDADQRIYESKCRDHLYEPYQSKLLNLSDTSHIPKSQCPMSIDFRISGGKLVKDKEIPHVAALGWFEKHLKFIHRCGGSLISEKWIITAAHCTENFLKKRGVARLGITRLSATKSGMIIGVVEIISHPNYKKPTLYADIALMRLARPVVFSDAIKPACLYSKFGDAPKIAWAAGWGSLDFDDEQVQDSLHQVQLEIIDTLPCALAYNQTIAIPYGIVPSMMCAGDPKGGWKGDTCNGDSGGPLQIFNMENCLHVIVGITSFGKVCGTPNFPGVYTRVAYYLDWIESIVWP